MRAEVALAEEARLYHGNYCSLQAGVVEVEGSASYGSAAGEVEEEAKECRGPSNPSVSDWMGICVPVCIPAVSEPYRLLGKGAPDRYLIVQQPDQRY